jgi:AP-1-like factor
MAGEIQRSAVAAQPYLTRNQQDLLAAALHSQANPLAKFATATGRDSASQAMMPPHAMANLGDDGLFTGPNDANFNAFDVDFTPELDFLDGDESFDFDDAELDGDLIPSLPGRDGIPQTFARGAEQKRKMSTEDDSLDAADAKRQETQEGERSSKKPGRTPLTNEPTTVSLL